jgi:transcriptional regulator with XRE-family HTH domain
MASATELSTSKRRKLIERLQRKTYRDAVVESEINNGLAFQIRTMQTGRGWSQRELGERAGGIAQETISLLENPSYGGYTLKTLKRLASAFDVALIVRFAPFSELADRMLTLSPSDLAIESFEIDEGLDDLSGIHDYTASVWSGEQLDMFPLFDRDPNIVEMAVYLATRPNRTETTMPLESAR